MWLKTMDNNDQPIDEPVHIEIDRATLEPQTRPGMAGHGWRQRGPYLYCTSCPIEHGVYIGTSKVMTGFNDDGTPRLEQVR